jgi:hypothetical protein
MIIMKEFNDDCTGNKFKTRLNEVIDCDREVLLDFSDATDYDLNILKEMFLACKKRGNKGTCIMIKNAPEWLETILLLINPAEENILLI